MAWKGRYKVKNLEKYVGDPTKVIYRSSWELAYMKWCDGCSRVLKWGSEEIVVPYRCPTDDKIHRYFIDFYVQVVDEKTGAITENLIEIKPYKETQPPKMNKNQRRYMVEVNKFVKNAAKWKHAKEYASQHGMGFHILTEKDLILPTVTRKNGTRKKAP